MNRKRFAAARLILLAGLVAGLSAVVSGCDLFASEYNISFVLGHMNESDQDPAWISVTDFAPREVAYQAFLPDNGDEFVHAVKLSKPGDFTIVVETHAGVFYSRKITVKDGARYSFYYDDAPGCISVTEMEN